MNLDDVQMEVLFPGWMRDGPDDLAMAEVVDRSIREIYARAQLLSVWDKIDQLPEEVLDRLAWELDIDWYDSGASIETKRTLIRESDIVHAKKGTVAAVESVIRAYFGESELMEWFEYGGEPHHFKVFTTEPTLVHENYERFLSMLERVKRHSSKLDSIMIGLTGTDQIFIGDAHRNFAHEIHAMGSGKLYLLTDVGTSERETVTVTMGADVMPDVDEIVYLVSQTAEYEGERIVVTMTTDEPLDGDEVGYLLSGVCFAQHEKVIVRIGG